MCVAFTTVRKRIPQRRRPPVDEGRSSRRLLWASGLHSSACPSPGKGDGFFFLLFFFPPRPLPRHPDPVCRVRKRREKKKKSRRIGRALRPFPPRPSRKRFYGTLTRCSIYIYIYVRPYAVAPTYPSSSEIARDHVVVVPSAS